MKSNFKKLRFCCCSSVSILGFIALSSFSFASEHVERDGTIEIESDSKGQLIYAIEERLKVFLGDIPLEVIKEELRVLLEEARKNGSKIGFLDLTLDQDFQSALNRINAIESKDQLILAASNRIDEMNSAGTWIFKYTRKCGREIYYKAGVAYFATPLLVFPLAFDLAFIWVEIPAEIIFG